MSWLAMTGAHPKTAQALARHASIETTMERYTDLTLVNLKGAVDRLPLPDGTSGKRRTAAPRVWNRRGNRGTRPTGS